MASKSCTVAALSPGMTFCALPSRQTRIRSGRHVTHHAEPFLTHSQALARLNKTTYPLAAPYLFHPLHTHSYTQPARQIAKMATRRNGPINPKDEAPVPTSKRTLTHFPTPALYDRSSILTDMQQQPRTSKPASSPRRTQVTSRWCARCTSLTSSPSSMVRLLTPLYSQCTLHHPSQSTHTHTHKHACILTPPPRLLRRNVHLLLPPLLHPRPHR